MPALRRPTNGRAAEKRDELAPPHSITSSARSSRDVAARGQLPWPLKVDYELIFGRRLHRQIGRLFALEDAIDIAGGPAKIL